MPINIDRAIATARKRLLPVLADTAVIERTGLSAPVWLDTVGRVGGSGGTRSVPGLPDFIRVPAFIGSFEVGTDLLANDIAAITNHLTTVTQSFHVMTVLHPKTYEVSVDADLILVSITPGGKLPIAPNDTIRFKNPRTGLSIECDAYTYRLDPEITNDHGTADYRWASIYDPTVLDGSGHSPTGTDTIYSSMALGVDANDQPRGQSLFSNPLKTFGIMPLATAFYRAPQ